MHFQPNEMTSLAPVRRLYPSAPHATEPYRQAMVPLCVALGRTEKAGVNGFQICPK
jgi:hypothetical protein